MPSDIPPKFQGTATKADEFGLYVLTVSGSCSCGATDWGLAPDWKVAAENGGGYMTSNCPECLGTMEYSEQWERVDRFVSSYDDLRPERLATDGGVPLTDDDECPSCGRQTLTERGITITHNDGTTGGSTWLNCINCDWDAKGRNNAN